MSSDLKAYLTIHNIDIVCQKLNSNPVFLLYDVNLEMKGYKLVQSDHPLQHNSRQSR